MYGRQWESSYGLVGDESYQSWSEALSQLQTMQIKRGIKALVAEGNEFPPNLIKFMRLCRQAPVTYHQPVPAALPRPVPRYSVMRIERAKMLALTGESFEPVTKAKKMVMDWGSEDEGKLCDLVLLWDESTGHEGLNALIDDYQFSHGTQNENSGVGEFHVDKFYHLGDGTIQYVSKTTPFYSAPYTYNGIVYPGNPFPES